MIYNFIFGIIQNIKPNFNDIIINQKIKKYINELIDLRKNFIIKLEEFGNQLLSLLIKEKNEIYDIFKSFVLKGNDLLTIKVFLCDNLSSYEEIKKKLEKMTDFSIDFVKIKEDKIINLSKGIVNEADIIFIIQKSEKLTLSFDLMEALLRSNQNVHILQETKNIFNIILKKIKQHLKNDSNLREKYFSRKPKISKDSYRSSEILTYNNLSLKIKDEIGIEIEDEKMISLLALDFSQNNKEYYWTKILENINCVYDLLKLQYVENNKDKLFKLNNEAFIKLNANVKASAFYDYIYYIFLPDFKYNLAKELYNKYIKSVI